MVRWEPESSEVKISEVSSLYTKADSFQEGRAGVLSLLTLLRKSASRWRPLTRKVLNFLKHLHKYILYVVKKR